MVKDATSSRPGKVLVFSSAKSDDELFDKLEEVASHAMSHGVESGRRAERKRLAYLWVFSGLLGALIGFAFATVNL